MKNERRKIGSDLFGPAYQTAESVFESKMTSGEGIQFLESIGMGHSSAKHYLYIYKCMRSGEVFKRAMSAPSMEYFLNRLMEDLGDESLEIALDTFQKHIKYLEGDAIGKRKKLRKVAANFENLLDQPRSLLRQREHFESRIESSLADSPEVRRGRLSSADRLPRKRKAYSEVYDRNPDVVAEVLHRAHGICENCKKPAPFKRRKNGLPYLEVHHVIHLANGGSDCVSNAQALCPNCHREFHYGCQN